MKLNSTRDTYFKYLFFAAPNGELVESKIVQQPDGDYKVEYMSQYTGTKYEYMRIHACEYMLVREMKCMCV